MSKEDDAQQNAESDSDRLDKEIKSLIRWGIVIILILFAVCLGAVVFSYYNFLSSKGI